MANPMAIFHIMFSIAVLVCAAIAYFHLRRVINSLKWPKVMASPRCWIDHYNENYSPMYKTEWTFLDLEGKVKTITPISASNVRYTRKRKIRWNPEDDDIQVSRFMDYLFGLTFAFMALVFIAFMVLFAQG